MMDSSGKPVTGLCPAIPAWKRIFDITCVVMAAPLWLPTTLAIALLISCISGRPVLFFQKRVGLGGQMFTCMKFRTMQIGTDEDLHKRHLAELMQANKPTVKLDENCDPRLIPLGFFLRATGMDELPQIFNILKGEMSLVGPRPCLPYEYENYEAAHMGRFNTLPGLTGLWQVSGKNRTTYSEMIELDINYVRHKSLWLDFKILLRTIPAIVAQVLHTSQLRHRIGVERSPGEAS
jgi:exopolysaccharide production protein ExoY